MTSMYFPLWSREDSSSASHPNQPCTGSGWRLPKRWFSVLLAIFGILTILHFLSRDQTPRLDTQQDSTSLSQQPPSTLPYFLARTRTQQSYGSLHPGLKLHSNLVLHHIIFRHPSQSDLERLCSLRLPATLPCCSKPS